MFENIIELIPPLEKNIGLSEIFVEEEDQISINRQSDPDCR